MDSADCHSNAITCIEMSNRATERQEQAVLLELARSWMEVAWELESDPDLRDALKDVRTFTRRRQPGRLNLTRGEPARFAARPQDWTDCF